MKCYVIAMILALAGSLCASGQGGFMVHTDSLQAGRNGSGLSVREVGGGYLLFSRQFSQEFPTRKNVHVRKFGVNGDFEYQFIHRTGIDLDFDFGFMDPIADLGDGVFAAAVAEGYSYPGETWLYTFDESGDTLSRKFLMTFSPEDSVTHAIRQMKGTSDGGMVLCGFFARPALTVPAFVVRLSAVGDTLWTGFYGQQDQAYDALGVYEYTDGGFVLTGYRNYGQPQNKSFLIRTDAQGNQLWRRLYGGIASQNGAVRIAADGGILTWSAYREAGWEPEWQQMMLTKWSPSGNVIWQRKVIKDYQVGTTDMEILPDGSIITAGSIVNRAALVKFSPDGDSLWTREYTLFSRYHFFYDVQPTSDGGFVCTGTAFGHPAWDPGLLSTQVIWVVKTDSLGCVVPGCHTAGVQEYLMDLNEHLRVWPNPLASGAPLTLSFTPPLNFSPNGPLRVVVLDALGRQVHAENFTDHTSPLTLHTSFATGLYHLHLTDNTRWLAGTSIVVE